MKRPTAVPPAASAADEALAAQQARAAQLCATVSVPVPTPDAPLLASVVSKVTERVCGLCDQGLISPREEETVLDHMSDWLELSNVSLQARQRLEALAELSEAMPIERAFARQLLRRVAK
eukprot:COSAG02_NODE_35863_length_462_cov_0.969697_1_plen_120_part_01